MTNYDSFYKSLAQAIDHANEVSRRRHIKAERYERIGQFMTSLRSYLTKPGYDPNGMYTVAMNKAAWYDIGVLEADSNLRGVNSGGYYALKDALVRCEAYRNYNFGDVESPESIREDLKDLKSELTVQQQQVQRLNQLNEKADQVVEKIVDLCERAAA